MTFVDFLAKLGATFVAGITIYLFFVKGKAISSIFKTIMGYTYQLTLTELTSKLENLNELTADDAIQNKQVVYILSEIVGQVKGNEHLRNIFQSDNKLLKKMEKYTEGDGKLTEPVKRSMVSQIREKLRTASTETYRDFSGDPR